MTSALNVRTGQAPVRVAVMLDNTVVPNWVARIIEEVDASTVAEIVLYLVRAPAPPDPIPPRTSLARLASGIGARWRTRLFSEYVAWDYRRHRSEPDAFDPIDIAGRVRQRASIVVEPITNGRTDRFSSSDLKVIRDRKIDVILRFGFRILRGD